MAIIYYKDQKPTKEQLAGIKTKEDLSKLLGFSVDFFGEYGLDKENGWEIDSENKWLKFKANQNITQTKIPTQVKFQGKDSAGNAFSCFWSNGNKLPIMEYIPDGIEDTGQNAMMLPMTEVNLGMTENLCYFWDGVSLDSIAHEFVPLPSSNIVERVESSSLWYKAWTDLHARTFKTNSYRITNKGNSEGIKGWCSKFDFFKQQDGNFNFDSNINYSWDTTGIAYKFGYTNGPFPILLYSNLNTLETADTQTHTIIINDYSVQVDNNTYSKGLSDNVVLYFRNPGTMEYLTYIPFKVSLDGGHRHTPGINLEQDQYLTGNNYYFNILGDKTTTLYATGKLSMSPIIIGVLKYGTYTFNNESPITNFSYTLSDEEIYSSIIKTFDTFSVKVNALKNVTDHYIVEDNILNPFDGDKEIYCLIGDNYKSEAPLTYGFSYNITVNNYQSLLGDITETFPSDNLKRSGQNKLQSGDVECYVSSGSKAEDFYLKLIGKVDCFNGVINNNLPLYGNSVSFSTHHYGNTLELGYYKKHSPKTYGIALVLWKTLNSN